MINTQQPSTEPAADPFGAGERFRLGVASRPLPGPGVCVRQSGMIAEVFLPGPKSDMELAAGPETGRGPVGVHHELMRAG